MRGRSLGPEDPLEEEMATHSSFAWEIPWTEGPGGQAAALGVAKGWTQLSTHEANVMEERVSGLLKRHKGRISPNLENLVIRVSLL